VGKLNDNEDIQDQIPEEDFANLFNIYKDSSLDNNAYTYSINRTINFNDVPNPGDKVTGAFYEYTVSMGETWTLISFKNYGTIRLWWLVCKLNKIKDPTKGPVVGQKIVLIKKEQVFNVLDQIIGFE
tara:strand:+ start:710 stop:1090 length:381 start_codon:yes stop_codon:yes gene_type:complete